MSNTGNMEFRIHSDDSESKYYTVSVWNNGVIFLSNQDGEGMGMSADDLYEHIDQFFKENH